MRHLFRAAPGYAGASAFAVDGVMESNQSCAVEAGCLTGDAAGGFPSRSESWEAID